MHKKIILVTGASSGIGTQTALTFAKQGHTVILHGRDALKTESIFKEIRQQTHNEHLAWFVADLSLLSEVQQFAIKIKEKYPKIDVLVNNAGGQFGFKRETTSEGHEKTMAINVLAPFLLTALLMECLANSAAPRVVTVSSDSYRQGGKPRLDDIELQENYSLTRAYGLSKLYVFWVMRAFAKKY